MSFHGRKSGPNGRRGAILVWTLLTAVLLSALGLGIVQMSSSSRQTHFAGVGTAQARFYAEAGLAYARHVHCTEGWADGVEVTLYPDGQTQVVISRTGEQWLAEAEAFMGTAMAARARSWGQLGDCGGGGGGGPGERPDDYVVYNPGSFAVPSGGDVTGSVYGEEVTLSNANVRVSENVVSGSSVSLGTRTQVGGFVCALDGDVVLRSSGTQVAGDVKAFGDVVLESGTEVLGSIYATGQVELEASNCYVGGDIHAGGSIVIKKGEIGGSLYAGWNVEIENGTEVGGEVHAGNEIRFGQGARNTIGGNAYAGGAVNDAEGGTVYEDSPPLVGPATPSGCPAIPPVPQLQSFTVGTGTTVVDDERLLPGVYGDVEVAGGRSITLQAGSCDSPGQAGCYQLASLGPGAWGQVLRLDFSTGDFIHVFAEGDIQFVGEIEVSTDGTNYENLEDLAESEAIELARRVYWETHGSFVMGTNNATRQWLGTVLARLGGQLPSGAYVVGTVASTEGDITVQSSNPTIIYALADFARENWVP